MQNDKILEICSNCGAKTDTIYDVFGDGLVLYCEDCYLNYLAEIKGLIND